MSISESGPIYRFGEFILDSADRQLWKNAVRISLNARYFDTLTLLVKEHGQLVGKDRFFDEVWNDVVVSDSALTQCIKDIRKQLGDDASDPHYIQTVPRHGYRFIAPVDLISQQGAAAPVTTSPASTRASSPNESNEATFDKSFVSSLWLAARWGIAGTLGGGLAGIFGGILYGSALSSTPTGPGLGTASILMVALSLNVLVGLIGGFGISFGMAVESVFRRQSPNWTMLGAALGGLVFGGLAKLLGVDAFTLFFGQAPAGITGGLEGAALGTAMAIGARLGLRKKPADGSSLASPWWPVLGGGFACALTGALIPLAGGRLMGGSLELIARSFEGSMLQLDTLAGIFGEVHIGMLTQVVLGGIEGLIFGACIVGTIILAQRISLPASD